MLYLEGHEGSRHTTKAVQEQPDAKTKRLGASKLAMDADSDDDMSPAAVRQELIQRIKSGEGSTLASDGKFAHLYNRVREESAATEKTVSSKLLPAIDLHDAARQRHTDLHEDASLALPVAAAGVETERPRSALHAGDFNYENSHPAQLPCCNRDKQPDNQHAIDAPPLSGSPMGPWFIPPRRQRGPVPPEPPPAEGPQPLSIPSPTTELPSPSPSAFQPSLAIPIAPGSHAQSRGRAPSLHSFSSNVILKTPTSPLVRETRNDDSEPSSLDLAESSTRSQRRHTFCPQSFQALTAQATQNFSTPAQIARYPPSLLRGNSQPRPGHYPRRSFTHGFPTSYHSTPQTPSLPASRRPSFSSDASPIQHASMVGSYEESILRGRMSTTPSKPFDFTAQIGALGKGDSKPKHPAHVSVDFPAVYYSWSGGISRQTAIDDEPSPYVGFIDLEQRLPPAQIREKRRRIYDSPEGQDPSWGGSSAASRRHVKREKRKQRSPSPDLKVPRGGSYRIPQQGQLQILIKSPNKTAVKLFLVPYDLSGMKPGTKTFVRQRSYSTGPIVEKPLSSKPSSETETGQKSTVTNGKPSLRYLIQLNICCPSKGRFYLHKSIQVVFANRVPDNKESLRIEVLWPEPRFSPYKAASDSASLAPRTPERLVENAQRRRSYGGPMAISDGILPVHGFAVPGAPSHLANGSFVPPVPSIPFAFSSHGDTGSRIDNKALHAQAPDLDTPERISPSSGSQTTGDSAGGSDPVSKDGYLGNLFGKLSRNDSRLGGVYGRPSTPEPGEGLLARRLRGFDLESSTKEQGGDLGFR